MKINKKNKKFTKVKEQKVEKEFGILININI